VSGDSQIGPLSSKSARSVPQSRTVGPRSWSGTAWCWNCAWSISVDRASLNGKIRRKQARHGHNADCDRLPSNRARPGQSRHGGPICLSRDTEPASSADEPPVIPALTDGTTLQYEGGGYDEPRYLIARAAGG
jgi:hypothetical protein